MVCYSLFSFNSLLLFLSLIFMVDLQILLVPIVVYLLSNLLLSPLLCLLLQPELSLIKQIHLNRQAENWLFFYSLELQVSLLRGPLNWNLKIIFHFEKMHSLLVNWNILVDWLHVYFILLVWGHYNIGSWLLLRHCLFTFLAWLLRLLLRILVWLH